MVLTPPLSFRGVCENRSPHRQELGANNIHAMLPLTPHEADKPGKLSGFAHGFRSAG